MKIEDIKIGETFNVRVKVCKMTSAVLVCHACDKDGHFLSEHRNFFNEAEVEAFSPVTPENGTKNTASAPKYDPCRRFRKGDKVEYHPKDGRELFEAERLRAQTLTVLENEHEEYNRVNVTTRNGYVLSVPFYYLKLVTPVEEMEPYSVEKGEYSYRLKSGDKLLANYWRNHPHAKAAAEAECARLNAEYRKEQK